MEEGAGAPFDAQLRETARPSWVLGLSAVLLSMVASCGPCVVPLAALPLGLMATSRARAVLAAPNLDAASEAYARTGQITGVAAAAWSAFLIAIVLAYLSLY